MLFFLQQNFSVIKERPLKGAFEEHVLPNNIWRNWTEGLWQDSMQSHYLDHFAFRNTMIHLNNELEYKLFDNLNVNKKGSKVYMIQTDDYPQLLHEKYLEAYFGRWKVDTLKENKKIQELHDFQEDLEAKGVHFVYLFAPNKTAFFEKEIREEAPLLAVQGNYPRLYPFFKKKFDQYGVHYIDFHDWFKDLQQTKEAPYLFSNVGTHWSLHGASLVTDSLLRYLKARGLTEIDHIEGSRHETTEVKYPDNDLEEMMNLSHELEHLPVKYLIREKDHPIVDLEFSTVGDSFWWQVWSENALGFSLTPNHYFMYYGNMVYRKKDGKSIDKKLPLVEKKDLLYQGKVVFCVSTEHNIPRVINGFLQIMQSK